MEALVPALQQQIELEIKTAAAFGIIGRSGAGKRHLAGRTFEFAFERPDSGQISMMKVVDITRHDQAGFIGFRRCQRA